MGMFYPNHCSYESISLYFKNFMIYSKKLIFISNPSVYLLIFYYLSWLSANASETKQKRFSEIYKI